jgi:hypothetical protein
MLNIIPAVENISSSSAVGPRGGEKNVVAALLGTIGVVGTSNCVAAVAAGAAEADAAARLAPYENKLNLVFN